MPFYYLNYTLAAKSKSFNMLFRFFKQNCVLRLGFHLFICFLLVFSFL